MNLEKLKDSARKFEQKEDWRKAIEVYLRAIQQIESGAETSPDLSLYNRVGDLYLKTNDTAAAVRSYERAVDLYADQGFFNNAIALCGKILRVNPGRSQTYLKLAQLHARKNVVIEAKRNLIEFLERMNGLGQLDQAFQSVKGFADQFSGSQEIRMMLVDLLRAASREDEAREQLEKLAGQLEAGAARRAADRGSADAVAEAPQARRPARGGLGGLVFLDTGTDQPAAGAAKEDSSVDPAAAPPDGLMVVEPVTAEPAEPGVDLIVEPLPEVPDELAPLPGLEQTPEIDFEPTPALPEDIVLERVEDEGFGFEGVPLEGMDETLLGDESGMPADEALLDVNEDLLVSVPEDEAAGDEEAADLDLLEAAPMAGLPLIDADAELPTVAELESRILDDPDNPALHRDLGEVLLAETDVARGLEELEIALDGYARQEEWAEAARVSIRLVGVAPDNVRYHQKRVELAFRSGERAPLLEAYLSLGDALGRAGAVQKAAAVYNRVLEHDPGNPHALAALAALAEPVDASGPGEEPAYGQEPEPAYDQEAPPAYDQEPEQAYGQEPESEIAAGVAMPADLAEEPDAPPEAPAPGAEQAEAWAAAEDMQPVPAPTGLPTPPTRPGHDAGFVDLGSMILDEEGPRDTRMRIDRRDPQGEDEQREFQEILEQFKRGIEENLEVDDYEAHYDLGIAFKEMGLMDEAIAEFQKALRAPEGRLRTSEALGICFYDKGQFAVSETVLRRAVDGIAGGDEAKIGLLYWLGRAAEAQGKDGEAIGSYERALAVDIRFMDLSQRIHRLTAGRRQ